MREERDLSEQCLFNYSMFDVFYCLILNTVSFKSNAFKPSNLDDTILYFKILLP